MLIADHSRPLDAMKRIDRPVLLIHGDADAIVPVSHSRELAKAGRKAELVVLAGGEHNSLRESHPEMEARVIEFFRTHLD
jgi:pimeloyl-ACP methyl ester carboxylesterase